MGVGILTDEGICVLHEVDGGQLHLLAAFVQVIHGQKQLHVALGNVQLLCRQLHVVQLADGVAVRGVILQHGSAVGGGIGVQLVYQADLLAVIVPAVGVHHHDGVVLTKGICDLTVGDAAFGEGIGVTQLQYTAGDDEDNGQGHHGLARLKGHPTEELALQNQLALLGLHHDSVQQEQKSGKQGQGSNGRQQDTFHQHHADVKADLEAHEQKGEKTGYGGQRAGRHGLQDVLDGARHGLVLVGLGLLPATVAVKQHDAVINGQSQLQNGGHGVGDVGDLTKDGVGAHVEQDGNARSQEQNKGLQPGLGGEEHDGHHQAKGNAHDDGDLPLNGLSQVGLFNDRTAVVGLSVEGLVQRRLHILDHGGGYLGILVSVDDDDEQSISVLEVALVVLVELNGQHVGDVLQGIADGIGGGRVDILDHHLYVAGHAELVLDDVEGYFGLGVLVQIVRYVIVDGHLAHQHHRQNGGRDEQGDHNIFLGFHKCVVHFISFSLSEIG